STESVRRGVRAALGRDTWKSQLEQTLRSNVKALKSNARKTRDTVVHWEVEQRTELPKKISRIKKAARKKWEAAA
ncbi:MAG TPA: hypothetical protein VF786_08245, partial [Terriglobales bacterium]